VFKAAKPNVGVEKSIFDGKSYAYLNYLPLEENYYVEATAKWAQKFKDQSKK